MYLIAQRRDVRAALDIVAMSFIGALTRHGRLRDSVLRPLLFTRGDGRFLRNADTSLPDQKILYHNRK
jgi:hypothetical protein